MAKADAERLLDDLDNDPDLYRKMEDASRQVLAVAKENGYDVSHNDIRSALNARHGMSIPMMNQGQPGQPGDPGDPGGPGADPMTTLIISEPPGR